LVDSLKVLDPKGPIREADIAEAIDMAGQIDAVLQRLSGSCACGDDGEVED
jgi:hypothetical protein